MVGCIRIMKADRRSRAASARQLEQHAAQIPHTWILMWFCFITSGIAVALAGAIGGFLSALERLRRRRDGMSIRSTLPGGPGVSKSADCHDEQPQSPGRRGPGTRANVLARDLSRCVRYLIQEIGHP